MPPLDDDLATDAEWRTTFRCSSVFSTPPPPSPHMDIINILSLCEPPLNGRANVFIDDLKITDWRCLCILKEISLKAPESFHEYIRNIVQNAKVELLIETNAILQTPLNPESITLKTRSNAFFLVKSPSNFQIATVSDVLERDHILTSTPMSNDRADREGSHHASESSRDASLIQETLSTQATDASMQSARSEDGQDGVNDDDEEEVENSDEDASSELSEGTDLRAEMEEVLTSESFDFKGTYAYGANLQHAPNPCIRIEGIGLVGQPLSERDAQLITTVANQAPFGMGERTVVDKAVRDTWELDPTSFTFANSAWDNSKSNLTLSYTSFSCTRPGHTFFPTKKKAKGMFATIIILLPSEYTGGEVYVSHGTGNRVQNQVFDYASTSLLGTACLAWYTDVMHEVKPVTSGYRFALAYNLIQSDPTISRPVYTELPPSAAALRRILRKWYEGMFEEEPETSMLVYILQHKYSLIGRLNGAVSLKGEDAHMLSHLDAIAEDCGFKLFLGDLQYHVSGCADDSGYDDYRWKRRRSSYDSYESDDASVTPGMLEESSTQLTLSSIVSLDGDRISNGHDDLDVPKDSLIPEDAFDGVEPDDVEYEGYLGNGAGSLEHSPLVYHRTALLIYPEHEQLAISFLLGGRSKYTISYLEGSTSTKPTSEESKLVSLALGDLNPYRDTSAIANQLLVHAIRWDDWDMYQKIVTASGADQKVGALPKAQLLDALRVFSFERMRSIFESLLRSIVGLQARLDFLNKVHTYPTKAEKAAVQKWVQEQAIVAVSTLSRPSTSDLPIMMGLLSARTIDAFISSVVPKLSTNTPGYAFWNGFLQSLITTRETIIGGDENTRIKFEKLVDTSLRTGIDQWDAGLPIQLDPFTHSAYSYGYYTQPIKPGPDIPHEPKITRILDVIKLCYDVSCPHNIPHLFSRVTSQMQWQYRSYVTVYTPLLKGIKDWLVQHGRSLADTPFDSCVRLLVEKYLVEVLKDKGHVAIPSVVRKLGCLNSCADCVALDRFLFSASPTITYRLAMKRREHVEHQLMSGREFVSFTTIRSGSPYGVKIEKHASVVASMQFTSRAKQANALLSAIGDNAILQRIMGSRFSDVVHAIHGTRPYALSPSTTAGPSTHTSAPAPGSSSVNPLQVAGSKRARVELGPVIDLTGDE
ncbi:hypothetical protein ONZ45_g12453 [Pleurotus djamor]|nr:hypothetical protein ONZ45_g12453 [Pleurotus djamor]